MGPEVDGFMRSLSIPKANTSQYYSGHDNNLIVVVMENKEGIHRMVVNMKINKRILGSILAYSRIALTALAVLEAVSSGVHRHIERVENYSICPRDSSGYNIFETG